MKWLLAAVVGLCVCAVEQPAFAQDCSNGCGYAVVDSSGNTYGVIVCDNSCAGGTLNDFNGCASCDLIVQAPADQNGNIAGYWGENVEYDRQSDVFFEHDGNDNLEWMLPGGAPLDERIEVPVNVQYPIPDWSAETVPTVNLPTVNVPTVNVPTVNVSTAEPEVRVSQTKSRASLARVVSVDIETFRMTRLIGQRKNLAKLFCW